MEVDDATLLSSLKTCNGGALEVASSPSIHLSLTARKRPPDPSSDSQMESGISPGAGIETSLRSPYVSIKDEDEEKAIA